MRSGQCGSVSVTIIYFSIDFVFIVDDVLEALLQ